ncbi:MAG: alpha/beta hydrolase [Betaproteobacteria bacterium]
MTGIYADVRQEERATALEADLEAEQASSRLRSERAVDSLRAMGQVSATHVLPLAVDGERQRFPYAGQRVAMYLSEGCFRSDALTKTPLLLVHSINAAASAAELRPVFEHYARLRPVVALELPGFGSSDRPDRCYDPVLMSRSILAAQVYMVSIGLRRAPDVMGVSLSCEFVARAVLEQPQRFRSVALVSPTGLEHDRRETPGKSVSKRKPWLLALLRCPLWTDLLFRALTSRPSLRWFLKRTWGSPRIDERLLDYDHLSAHQPGARHAPLTFIAGGLFTRGAAELYRRLPLPVWLAHGTRGAFADYDGVRHLDPLPLWRRERFETGALPYFEQPLHFCTRFDAFVTSAQVQSRDSGDHDSH